MAAFVKPAKALLPGSALEALDPILDQLQALALQIKACDEKTERPGKVNFQETRILRQVAGVGPVLVLCYACMIDDVEASKETGP